MINSVGKLLLGATTALCAALAVGVVPSVAQSTGLEVLTTLNKGEWTVRFRDRSDERKICVRSGLELIQLRHSQPNCSRFVVEEGSGEVTVQYTCPGNGYGRSSIRRETATLVQIDGQGISNGLPFQFSAEARRTGTCS